MVLQLNKTELAVLKDVFGKRLHQFGISTKTTLTQSLARKLHTMIADEFDAGYVQGDEADVLNDIMEMVS
jgi:nicotinamide riboside kinase